jgi:hypothetical protein
MGGLAVSIKVLRVQRRMDNDYLKCEMINDAAPPSTKPLNTHH